MFGSDTRLVTLRTATPAEIVPIPGSVARVTDRDHSPLIRHPLTRRAVLAGAASTIALAACSSKGSGKAADDTLPKPVASLLAFFPLNDYVTAQVPQRVAFGIANPGGGLATKGPNPLKMTIAAPGGVTTTQQVAMHGTGLPNVYYPLNFTPAKAGNFTVSAVVDGSKVSATFTVGAKGSSDVPGPTDKMPALKTPTVADHLSVDPICTQNPPCKLHEVSLDAALAQARPVAYLVGTPKFCQTGICGPVLDVLETTAPAYVDKVTFIHQEVYQSAEQAADKGSAATLAKAVQDLHLQSEPVLFITDASGIIRHRLDASYDATELRRVLDDVIG